MQIKLYIEYTSLAILKIQNRFDTGNWINLKIGQNNKIYEIKIDDKLVYKTTNSNPKSRSNVTVVIGNTYSSPLYFSIAIGQYQNFEIYSCLSAGKTSKIDGFRYQTFSTFLNTFSIVQDWKHKWC